MYQNYGNAFSTNKNNFLWIGQPGNTIAHSVTPLFIPSTAIGMFFIVCGAGGNGGNGATSNGSSNYSGGAGGGSPGAQYGIISTSMIPKLLYIIGNSANNTVMLSIIPDPGTSTQMGLSICGSGGTGANGALGATSSGGAAGVVTISKYINSAFVNTNAGSAGRSGTSGAAGTDFNYANNQPIFSIGPSGGGMAATTTFVGGGASSLAILRSYINTQAGGAIGSNGSNGQTLLPLNSIFLGTSGSGGGSTNGGIGGNGGPSGPGCGGAGGGTGTTGGGAGSLGGPPFVFIQFW